MPVEYQLATGAIAIAVSGLPSGTSANLLVTGPDGYSQPVTGTITLTGLVPGAYRMSSSPVNVGLVYNAAKGVDLAVDHRADFGGVGGANTAFRTNCTQG